ncbi:MAG: hypothetical protein WD669_03465 [Pirellulales bacterium]
MKRTLLVLALAICVSAGCRAVGPRGGSGCGQSCGPGGCQCGEPVGGCDSCGSGCNGASCGSECNGTCAGCGENSCHCQGPCDCGMFNRHCGCADSCGAPGPYDCSPCNSPAWGCNGYGYCQPRCRGMCGGHPMLQNGYCCCCGQPGPSCCCTSGDQYYNFTPGPPVGHTAYPYYTVRGPRDFLLNNPPRLGPY